MVTAAVGDLPAVQALAQGRRTVSSTALKNASGIEPSSTSSRNGTPVPTGPARPAARRWPGTGCESVPLSSNAAPAPTGRSMQIVVVSRNVDLDAEVGGQRGLDDLLLHLAVERDGDLPPHVVLAQGDQRVLLGELGERGVQRARRSGAARHDDGLQRRRREVARAGRRRARSPNASPIRTSRRPHSLPIRPAGTDRRGMSRRRPSNTPDRR